MGNSHEEHRPLRAGLWIRTGKPKANGGLEVISNGTLTAVATRNSDGKKVLVTYKHVMAVPAKGSA